MAQQKRRTSAKRAGTKRPARKRAATKRPAAKRSAAGASATRAAATGAPARKTARKPAPPFPAQHQPRPGLQAKMNPQPHYEAQGYRGADKLAGKVALITGGDSGIGRAVAVLFAREGADVAVVYLAEEQVDAEETKRAVEGEGRRCLLLPGDVRRADFCESAVDQVASTLGRLDVLVNNAAYQHHQKSIEDISDEQFAKTFQTNIFGYFYMARAALRHLKKGSAIVNTGSITGLEGNKELLDYAATKGAIHAFTKSLAQQLVDRGIRVNCVAPGPVWTPLNVADKPARKVAKQGEEQPMGRPGQPDEVAPAFVYFASNVDSSYVSGEILTLLGGETRAG